ncbi:Kinase family protein isoform 2 [Theobroma cacao]|uniref:Kinase family protein isoform 2 n=1 Tax=Theobroma cacao TaxID=3641 RepID=A0A061EG31_THECC|nr:Kinase family protein isoform 2 [Theobroma cacao]
MGFYEETCTNSRTTKNGLTALYAATSTPPTDHCCDYNESKIKSLFAKMIWDFGFACILPGSQRKGLRKNQKNNGEKKGRNLEHNKAWLLAESGGGAELTSTEPQSVHSSFRFSFCSQVELEAMNANSLSSATVLMVNLDNGVSEERAKELKWRRIESLERSISPVANCLVRFSYGEIVSATRNFSKGRVLGRGALSFVFRGRVGLLKTAVAIKRLDKEDKESAKAFCRELMIASSLHHPNIVPLLGFCIDPEEGLFLVYKFVSGGSLERHLHDKKGVKGRPSTLPWSVRYKVALGIAEAVAYLHNGTERCVVHRDIKPSNILLSSTKPLLHRGMAAVEELLDSRLKCTLKNLTEIARMIQAAAACISNEESRRPVIDEIIAILRGEEEPFYSIRKKSNFSGIIDCYPQLQHSKSEMKSHLALAMLGVSEFEDGDHLYCR